MPMPPGVRDNPRVTPSPGGRGGARIASTSQEKTDQERVEEHTRECAASKTMRRDSGRGQASPLYLSLKLLSFSLSSFVALFSARFLLSLSPFRDRRRWLSRNHVAAASFSPSPFFFTHFFFSIPFPHTFHSSTMALFCFFSFLFSPPPFGTELANFQGFLLPS